MVVLATVTCQVYFVSYMTGAREKPARIDRGGIATPAGFLYELTGGELCLDLANTLDSRPTREPRELITDYDDLVRWSVQAEILAPRAARRLQDLAARHPRRAANVLRRA